MKKNTPIVLAGETKAILVGLAKRYAEIAMQYDCKTGRELSQKTFELREAGEDLPYLAVVTTNTTWTPTPRRNQKKWGWWIDRVMHDDLHSEDGWFNLYVDNVESGFKIQVYNGKYTTTTDADNNRVNSHTKTVIIEWIFKFDYQHINKLEK